MRYLIYLLIAVLIAASVSQCAGIRTSATRVQSARARRIDELTE